MDILTIVLINSTLQDDTSGCDEPPVDFKTKVPGQAKMELLFISQHEDRHNRMCQPVNAQIKLHLLFNFIVHVSSI